MYQTETKINLDMLIFLMIEKPTDKDHYTLRGRIFRVHFSYRHQYP